MRIGFALILVFAAACAGAPVPNTYYLMRADLADGVARTHPPVTIGLGDVDVAPYLLEPGLVLETGTHEMRSARRHLWAEPLDASLRLYLRAQISNELGYDVSGDATSGQFDYVVDIAVEQLHGTLSGAARLVASWRIAHTQGTEKPAAYRFVRTRPLAQDGYAALAEAEVALTSELATAIANSLRDLGPLPAGDLGQR